LPDFTLPSGRIVQLKERATWGDISDAQDTAQIMGGKMNHYYRALDSIMSGLSIDEIRSLDPDDGRALEKEVMRRAGARSVEDEAPFATPSISESTTDNPSSTPSPNGE
jgi:hypothetical protein